MKTHDVTYTSMHSEFDHNSIFSSSRWSLRCPHSCFILPLKREGRIIQSIFRFQHPLLNIDVLGKVEGQTPKTTGLCNNFHGHSFDPILLQNEVEHNFEIWKLSEKII